LTGGIITTLPANAADTGIRGTVLWGPVHGGPVRLGQSDEAPLRAIFHVLDSEHEVARFESDGKGSFEVLPDLPFLFNDEKGIKVFHKKRLAIIQS
jgi:hypothetical protein